MSVSVERFGKVESNQKFRRGGFEKGKVKRGSFRYVVLNEGSVIRWWNGVWIFKKVRLDRKVSKSLNLCHLVESEEEGREVVDQERYSDFGKFSERMVGIVGVEEFMRIVNWMKG